MKNIKKITAFALCFLVLLGLSSVFTGCDGDDAVIKVGSAKVPANIYKYFYFNTKQDISDSDKLSEYTESNLKNAYAVIDMAKKYSVKFTSDDEKELTEYIDSLKTQFPDEESFISSLKMSCLDEESLYEVLRLQNLKSKLFERLTDEISGEIDTERDTVTEYIKNNFYRATQIFIMNDDGDSIEDNKVLAEDLRKMLDDGADFNALLVKYGEDTALINNPDAYYCAVGEKIEEFEKNALALGIGEISDVVSSDLGFHIIKRLEIKDDYIDAHYDEMLYKYESCIFNEMYNSFCDSLTLKYCKGYDELDLSELEHIGSEE